LFKELIADRPLLVSGKDRNLYRRPPIGRMSVETRRFIA